MSLEVSHIDLQTLLLGCPWCSNDVAFLGGCLGSRGQPLARTRSIFLCTKDADLMTFLFPFSHWICHNWMSSGPESFNDVLYVIIMIRMPL